MGFLFDAFSSIFFFGVHVVCSCLMQKRARVSREMTFQDIYDAEALLNEDDEEDDSDWEPVQTPLEYVKWSCVNCTMANPGDMVHCFVRLYSSCLATTSCDLK